MALSRDKLQVWMHGKSFDHLTTSIGSNTIALISNCLDQMAAPPTAGATDRMLSLGAYKEYLTQRVPGLSGSVSAPVARRRSAH